MIYPLPQAPDVSTASLSATPSLIPQTYFKGDSTKTPVLPTVPLAPPPTIPYFLTIGNSPPMSGASESAPYQPYLTLATAPVNYDPLSGTPTTTLPLGVLPQPTTGPAPTYPNPIRTPTPGSGQGTYYWVCLRRPANPFAGVSATNPMIVVDCMRFPYIEAGGTVSGTSVTTQSTGNIYSYQRLQPFRGGHAVPMLPATTASPIDPRYGYTEQIVAPVTPTLDYVQYNGNPLSTNPLYHTLGFANDGTLYPGLAGPPAVAPISSSPGITSRSMIATSPASPSS